MALALLASNGCGSGAETLFVPTDPQTLAVTLVAEDGEDLVALERGSDELFAFTSDDEVNAAFVGIYNVDFADLGLAPGDNRAASREGRSLWRPLELPTRAYSRTRDPDGFEEVEATELPPFRVDLMQSPCERVRVDATQAASIAAKHLIKIDESRVAILELEQQWIFEVETGVVEAAPLTPPFNEFVSSSAMVDGQLFIGTNRGRIYPVDVGSDGWLAVGDTARAALPLNSGVIRMVPAPGRDGLPGLLIVAEKAAESGSLSHVSGINTSTPSVDVLIPPAPAPGSSTARMLWNVDDQRYLVRVNGRPETFQVEELNVTMREDLVNLVTGVRSADGTFVGVFASSELVREGSLIKTFSAREGDVLEVFEFEFGLFSYMAPVPHGVALVGRAGTYQQMVKRSPTGDYSACEARGLFGSGSLQDFIQIGNRVIAIQRGVDETELIQATAVQ